MPLSESTNSTGTEGPLVQHKCRHNKKHNSRRKKLQAAMQEPILHARGTGIRGTLDSPVVRPMRHQHSNVCTVCQFSTQVLKALQLTFKFSFRTLTTFLIDTERFKYPERPIVFLSMCYFMVATGYLMRIFIGHEHIACDGTGIGAAIKYSSVGRNPCTLVFLLIYFFGMSSSIWWVVLAFTWFLAAGLKWGNEAIAKHSTYFHLGEY